MKEMEEEILSLAVDGIEKEELEVRLKMDQQEFVLLINKLLKRKKVELKKQDGKVIVHALQSNKSKLSTEQDAILEAIKYTGKDGLWSKHIRSRTQLHPSRIEKALKALTELQLITTFKHVEYPTRIYYISASVQPSEAATGGPWFTDNVLDTAFVEGLSEHIFKYIQLREKKGEHT